MESIKFNAKGHNIEFSKRNLTIDGKVYSYTGISQIKHSSAYHAYLFRYNGEWVKLFYNEADGKTVAALFKRIQKMNERRAAHARATQSIDTSAIAAALAAASGEEKSEAKAGEPEPEAPAAEPAVEPEPEVVEPIEPEVIEPVEPEVVEPTIEPEIAEPAAEPETAEPAAEPEVSAEEPEGPAEEPAAEPEAEKPKETAEEEPEEKAEEKPAEEEPAKDAETIAAEAAEAAVKKAKRKKGLMIFAIILAIFIIAGIIYFLTLGPTNDAAQSPNTDETHQYNDIEELIEEMQE